MISLIIATKPDVPKNFSNATLVVVPLSVLSNWEKQIQDHCVENTLTYCSYYGAQRAQLGSQALASHDVVFTTYQTVAGEHDNPRSQPVNKKKKAEKALFGVRWKVDSLLNVSVIGLRSIYSVSSLMKVTQFGTQRPK